MSSILDALRKLEAEKAEASRAENAPFEPESAKYELVGKSGRRGRMPFRASPVFVISGAIILASIVIGVSIGLTLMLTRSQGVPLEQVARAAAPNLQTETPAKPAGPPRAESAHTAVKVPPRQVPAEPVIQEPKAKPNPAPKPVAKAALAPEPAPEPVAKAAPAPEPAPEPVAKAAPAPEPAPEPVAKAAPAPEPAPEPVAKAEPAPEPEPAPVAKAEPAPEPVPEPAKAVPAPEPAAKVAAQTEKAVSPAEVKKEELPALARPLQQVAKLEPPVTPTPSERAVSRPEKKEADVPKKQSRPLDLMSLPVLRASDKAQYGLEGVRVNMVRPASKTRTYASAIINLEPVQVGEKIPGSDAILIGVESRSIGIEIEGTGERFQIRF